MTLGDQSLTGTLAVTKGWQDYTRVKAGRPDGGEREDGALDQAGQEAIGRIDEPAIRHAYRGGKLNTPAGGRGLVSRRCLIFRLLDQPGEST